jgi:hypothetical protein
MLNAPRIAAAIFTKTMFAIVVGAIACSAYSVDRTSDASDSLEFNISVSTISILHKTGHEYGHSGNYRYDSRRIMCEP